MQLVSGILITRGRQQWAAQALECFLSQTYPEKELVIVDDMDDVSFPVPPKYPNVSHVILRDRLAIPQKRNHGVRISTGELIANFDSDDWSAPTRLAEQVKLLEESHMSITGYHSLLFYSAEYGVWKFVGRSQFPMGTSLLFTREFWSRHPFERDPNSENEHTGEDGMFSRAARQENAVISIDAESRMVARIHPGNTSVKNIHDRSHQEWHRWTGGLPTGFTP